MAGSRLRTRLPVLLALSFLWTLMSAPVLAESAGSPSMRQLLLMQDSDLAGRDFRILKEVELDVCESACLSEARCQAFTYNTKARWCFLKEGVERPGPSRRPSPGASSGPSVRANAAARSLRRCARRDPASAARLLEEASRPGGQALPASTRQAVTEATAQPGQGEKSGRRGPLRRRAAPLPDDRTAWLGLAQAAMAAARTIGRSRSSAQEGRLGRGHQRLPALRRQGGAGRALATLGRALAPREQWRPAIRATRAALALGRTRDLRAEYEAWRSHGFRVSGHQVDSDGASPRICIQFSDPLAAQPPGPGGLRAGGGRPRAVGRDRAAADLHRRRGPRWPLPHPGPRRAALGGRRDPAENTADLESLCRRPRPHGAFPGPSLCPAQGRRGGHPGGERQHRYPGGPGLPHRRPGPDRGPGRRDPLLPAR